MRTPGLVDSHLHLQDFETGTDVSMLIKQALEAGVSHFVCNGTSENDWEAVEQYAERHREIIPCFGLHPWFVTKRSEDWIQVLEGYIRSTPSGVGETGLDKLAENFDRDAQEEVFRAQLEIARKYDRPTMVHCVRAWGWLIDVLRSEPINECGMLFHAYGGSVDLIKPLADMGAYFSFSGTVLKETFMKSRDALRAIPADRLLIESDAPNMLPPERFRTYAIQASSGIEHNHPANLANILDGIADLLQEPSDKLRERLWQNSQKFFGQITDLEK